MIKSQTTAVGQVIRVYTGKRVDHDFHQDATIMGSHGWHIVTQSYGGTKNPGCLSIFTFGLFAFLGKKKPTELTVIYSR